MKYLLALIVIVLTLGSSIYVYSEGNTDQSGPACSITYKDANNNPITNSQQQTGTTITVTVTADDSQTGGHGVSAITLSLTPSPASPIPSSTTSPLTYRWTPTSGGGYAFSATATDTIGNTNTSCTNPIPTFNITATPAYEAWIQVTGDIHSNTRISIPSGQ